MYVIWTDKELPYFAGHTDTGLSIIYHWSSDKEHARKYDSFLDAWLIARGLRRDGDIQSSRIEEVS